MKNKINSLLIVVVLLVTCLSFVGLDRMQSEQELIIGNWIPEGSSNSKRVFNQDGKCYDYYKNILVATYTWSIISNQTSSGLIIKDLKLVNVNNEDEIYHYMVEVSNNILTLIWSERPSSELIYTKIDNTDNDS